MRISKIVADLFHIGVMIGALEDAQRIFNRFLESGISADDEGMIRMLTSCFAEAGEELARKKISHGLRERFDYVDWVDLRDLRNDISHEYHKIQAKEILEMRV